MTAKNNDSKESDEKFPPKTIASVKRIFLNEFSLEEFMKRELDAEISKSNFKP